MSTEEIKKRQADRKFQAWRQRVQAGLPTLATRIFALRSVTYAGCGFHYAMEHDLGVLIAQVNNYNKNFDIFDRINIEVISEMIYKRVAEAEKSRDCWLTDHPIDTSAIL